MWKAIAAVAAGALLVQYPVYIGAAALAVCISKSKSKKIPKQKS